MGFAAPPSQHAFAAPAPQHAFAAPQPQPFAQHAGAGQFGMPAPPVFPTAMFPGQQPAQFPLAAANLPGSAAPQGPSGVAPVAPTSSDSTAWQFASFPAAAGVPEPVQLGGPAPTVAQWQMPTQVTPVAAAVAAAPPAATAWSGGTSVAQTPQLVSSPSGGSPRSAPLSLDIFGEEDPDVPLGRAIFMDLKGLGVTQERPEEEYGGSTGCRS